MTTPAEEKRSSQEWQLIEKIVLASTKDQRNARRWGIFFKLLTFFYLFLLFVLIATQGKLEQTLAKYQDHVAVVDINGPIMADSGGFMSATVSALQINKALERAFNNQHAKAVLLRINSPGGSPVQSGYVYDEIRRLRKLNPNMPVYAVISDIGASGAYYIASAADKIYADKASLVGSIGVIHASFGFVDAINKLGIERRVITSGENKDFMDPFAPLNEEHKARLQEILDEVHQQFIRAVKDGRGDRLKDNPEIFSGLVWTGEDAVKLGLIDGLGSPQTVARDIIGNEILINYVGKPTPIEQLMQGMSESFVSALLTQLNQQSKIY